MAAPDLLDHPDLDHLADRYEFGNRVTVTYEHGPLLSAADDALIGGVHLVPFVGGSGGDRCVVCRLDDGEWMMPGGTLEPGEAWRDAAARELLEEAGARLLDVTPFGLLRIHNGGERWRVHVPWPTSVCLIGWAEVDLVGPPACPPDGEHVVEVRVTTVDEAARLVSCTWPLNGDLYRLAARLRSNACSAPSRPAAG